MRFSLLLLTIGICFIVSGSVQDKDPKCAPTTSIRILPRNVYDQLVIDSSLLSGE